jgi:hypothetical protein
VGMMWFSLPQDLHLVILNVVKDLLRAVSRQQTCQLKKMFHYVQHDKWEKLESERNQVLREASALTLSLQPRLYQRR